jgi:hypothetical protein
MKTGRNRAVIRRDESTLTISWLECLLAASVLTLVFQLFPSLWAALSSYVDVRGWTWRSYAAASALAIVVLVAAKAWQDNAWEQR